MLHRDLLKERERGREDKRTSRDLSNKSLKTDGETESGEPRKGSLEREREGKRGKKQEKRSE